MPESASEFFLRPAPWCRQCDAIIGKNRYEIIERESLMNGDYAFCSLTCIDAFLETRMNGWIAVSCDMGANENDDAFSCMHRVRIELRIRAGLYNDRTTSDKRP